MRATDLKDVTVRVPGSCGELLQGWHAGGPFLVTCPIARYTTVRASVTLSGFVGLGEKSRRALQRSTASTNFPPICGENSATWACSA